MYVAAVGYQGAGKSFILRRWKEIVGDAVVVDVAYPLKQGAAQLLGLTVEQVEKDKQNLRVFLQEYGRLAREYGGVDWLIEQAVEEVEESVHGAIENLRMMNEYEYISKRSDWFIFGVQCDDEIRKDRLKSKYGRLPTEEELNHSTEREIETVWSQGIPVFVNNTPADAEMIASFLAGLI